MHKRYLIGNYHENKRMQNAWNKYGASAFSFSVIEDVPIKTNLVEREQYWIDFFCSASRDDYNICPTAGSMLGVKMSDETKEKMRSARQGKKRSPESIAKTAASNTGKKRSEETCKKISVAKAGKKMHPNTAKAIRESRLGHSPSAETRIKLSNSNKATWDAKKDLAKNERS